MKFNTTHSFDKEFSTVLPPNVVTPDGTDLVIEEVTHDDRIGFIYYWLMPTDDPKHIPSYEDKFKILHFDWRVEKKVIHIPNGFLLGIQVMHQPGSFSIPLEDIGEVKIIWNNNKES